MQAFKAISHGTCACVLTVALSCSGTLLGVKENSARAQQRDTEMSPISGPASAPRRHFRLRSPADLSPARANELYQITKAAQQIGYALSGHPVAKAYQGWKRYNTSPYLSKSHGNHYLNNYANAKAAAYGKFEDAGTFPVGSVIAKDSYSATPTGELIIGPLFIMEKMPKSFEYITADWKFTEILADGTVLGQTNGKGSERVEYCISCHLSPEEHDLLYFPPKNVRIRPDK